MAETMTDVRADIEQTRARIAGAIAELEKKADVAERVREHPWAALAIAFGAGFALSRSPVKAQQAPVDAKKETGNRLGSAFDQIVTAAIGGMVGALHTRVEEVVSGVAKSVHPAQRVTPPVAPPITRPVGTVDRDTAAEAPIRAD